MKISKIITTLCYEDIDVFIIGKQYLDKYIRNNGIIISVPDFDFEKISNKLFGMKNIDIRCDSEVLSASEIIQIKLHLTNIKLMHRYGWYLQQFIKIKILSDLSDNEIGLIWDADTVPLRPLKFINNDKSLNYFIGYEYHEPYFETIYNILGITKQIPDSFIAQCFPIYGSSVTRFIELMGGNSAWISKILNGLSNNTDNRFSEYETLGTYLAFYEPEKMRILNSKWLREGYRYIIFCGSLEKAIHRTAYKYCYVAFEKIKTPLHKKIFFELKRLVGS